jgi:uncharacterized protein
MLQVIDTPATLNAKVTGPLDNGASTRKRRTRSRQKRSTQAPSLEVRESSIHGRGVYATEGIRKGKRIIEYKGRIVPWELASEQADGPHTFLFGLTNGKDVIDPDFGGNDARWINHSCEPNCEAIEERNRVFIYALRAILPGEELFYDYGLEVDQPRTRKLEKEYECRCGSRGCRGTLLAAAEKKSKKRTA